jgi:urease accessory protein
MNKNTTPLIVEAPMGRIDDVAHVDLTVDLLPLDWYNSTKRINRLTSRDGMDIGLRLSDAAALRGWCQGDVVAVVGSKAVTIEIIPCKCLAVHAESQAQLVRLCYEVGNRHAPFFYEEQGEGFLLCYDEPMLRMLERLGFKPEAVQARLLADRRISAAAGHGHGHGSDHDAHEHTQGHAHSHDHGY